MKPLLAARIALALTAIALFGMGIRADSEPLRLAAIIALAAALALRFLGRRRD